MHRELFSLFQVHAEIEVGKSSMANNVWGKEENLQNNERVSERKSRDLGV